MTKNPFISLSVGILVVSDTRTESTDRSGQYLADALQEAGHRLFAKQFVRDDVYAIRAIVSTWIADATVDVIVLTGGTGFAKRDVTPSALLPLFDVEVPGFGELFRSVSVDTIGTSVLQTRVTAGIANQTLIFCLPGSLGACRDAWRRILIRQLDSRHKPCNFVAIIFPDRC